MHFVFMVPDPRKVHMCNLQFALDAFATTIQLGGFASTFVIDPMDAGIEFILPDSLLSRSRFLSLHIFDMYDDFRPCEDTMARFALQVYNANELLCGSASTLSKKWAKLTLHGGTLNKILLW